jgi:hypothetical protein
MDPNLETLNSMHRALEEESAKRRAAYAQASADLLRGAQTALSNQTSAGGAYAARTAMPVGNSISSGVHAYGAALGGIPDRDGISTATEEEIRPDEEDLAGDSALNDSPEYRDKRANTIMQNERDAIDVAAQSQSPEANAMRQPNGTMENRIRGREIGDFLHDVRNPQMQGSQQGYSPDVGPKPSMSPAKAHLMSEIDKAVDNAVAGINNAHGVRDPQRDRILAELEAATRKNTVAPMGAQNPQPQPAPQQSPMAGKIDNATNSYLNNLQLPTGGPAVQMPSIQDYAAFLQSQGYK